MTVTFSKTFTCEATGERRVAVHLSDEYLGDLFRADGGDWEPDSGIEARFGMQCTGGTLKECKADLRELGATR